MTTTQSSPTNTPSLNFQTILYNNTLISRTMEEGMTWIVSNKTQRQYPTLLTCHYFNKTHYSHYIHLHIPTTTHQRHTQTPLHTFSTHHNTTNIMTTHNLSMMNNTCRLFSSRVLFRYANQHSANSICWRHHHSCQYNAISVATTRTTQHRTSVHQPQPHPNLIRRR